MVMVAKTQLVAPGLTYRWSSPEVHQPSPHATTSPSPRPSLPSSPHKAGARLRATGRAVGTPGQGTSAAQFHVARPRGRRGERAARGTWSGWG